MDNPAQTLNRLDDDDKALLPMSQGEGNSNPPCLGHRAELMWFITEPAVSEREHQAQMVNFGTD